jgi:predicted nucleotidyltransferase
MTLSISGAIVQSPRMPLDPFPTVLGYAARALSRMALRTEQTFLRPLWAALYGSLARIAAAYLRRGLPRVSVHLAGSLGRGEPVYGLSDLDLVVVVPGSEADVQAASAAVDARRRRLRRFVPGFDRLANVAVFGERRLVDEWQETCLTHGIDRGGGREPDGGYLRPVGLRDDLLRHLLPGLWGPGSPWTHLAGPPVAWPPPPASAAYRRLTPWLQLQWWWRYSFLVATHPELHSAPYNCFKLVAEPARIWLWLAAGERAGRRGAIARAIDLLPAEEAVLRRALDLRARLGRSPEPPIADTLGWLVRCATRISALIETEIAAEPRTEVDLIGDAGSFPSGIPEAAGAEAAPVPFVDWRARVMPRRVDEVLVPLTGDPTDPAAVAAASRLAAGGVHPVLRRDGLLVLPTEDLRQALRAVQFADSDPVSFALLGGRSSASFPDVPGWSARDSALRAVAEHRNWLALREQDTSPVIALERLITAARAALFLESFEAGQPRLPMTGAATMECLADRFPDGRAVADAAVETISAARTDPGQPDSSLLRAARQLVGRLPVYGAGSMPELHEAAP